MDEQRRAAMAQALMQSASGDGNLWDGFRNGALAFAANAQRVGQGFMGNVTGPAPLPYAGGTNYNPYPQQPEMTPEMLQQFYAATGAGGR